MFWCYTRNDVFVTFLGAKTEIIGKNGTSLTGRGRFLYFQKPLKKAEMRGKMGVENWDFDNLDWENQGYLSMFRIDNVRVMYRFRNFEISIVYVFEKTSAIYIILLIN